MKSKKLTEICTPKQWKTIPQSEMLNSGYPVYGANGIIGYYNQYNHSDPTVLITCRGATCGTLNISKPYSYINGNAMALDNVINEIDEKYLFYFLNNRGLHDTISGSAQPQITIQGLSKVIIDYPSIEEQKKISKILDKADEIRQKKKLANEKLDEFLKSTFIDMFGDPVRNEKGFNKTILQNIGSFKNGINYNAGDNGYLIKCIGVGDFKNGTILNNIGNLSNIEVNQKPNEEYFLKKNDIVFVRSNGSKELVGRTLLIDTNLKENIVYSGFCIRLRVEQECINNMFLLQLLNTKPIKDTMKNDGHGCNIKSLNQTILGHIPVIIPPIEEQNKFAQIVEKVEAQKQKNELVIEQMNNLFNSLSQRAFKGNS